MDADRDEPTPAPRVAPNRRRLLGETAALLRAELRRREGGRHVGPRSSSRGRQVVDALRMTGMVAFTAVVGILIAVMVVMGVGGLTALGEPVHWGTYTEERCDRARFGCRSFGTWVSDSGELRLAEVQLDGAVGDDGTTRAAYRPTGFNNDADNGIVHAEPWATLGPWMPWALVLLFGGVLVIQWSTWLPSGKRG